MYLIGGVISSTVTTVSYARQTRDQVEKDATAVVVVWIASGGRVSTSAGGDQRGRTHVPADRRRAHLRHAHRLHSDLGGGMDHRQYVIQYFARAGNPDRVEASDLLWCAVRPRTSRGGWGRGGPQIFPRRDITDWNRPLAPYARPSEAPPV